jgi:hypothetical protein
MALAPGEKDVRTVGLVSALGAAESVGCGSA